MTKPRASTGDADASASEIEPVRQPEPIRPPEPLRRHARPEQSAQEAEKDELDVFADAAVDATDPLAPKQEPAEKLAAWFTVRTTRILWVVAIVAAAVMSAAVTFALVKVTPVASSSGAPQITTLDATSTREIPAGWMGVGTELRRVRLLRAGSRGERGRGTSTVPSERTASPVARWDQVPDKDDFDSSSGWSYDGPTYTGCAVGTFPATVEVPFDSNVPKELSERFPSATALQFVYDGERVGVFLDSE